MVFVLLCKQYLKLLLKQRYVSVDYYHAEKRRQSCLLFS